MAAPGNTILLTYPEENPLEANPPWPSIFLDLEVPAELQKLNKDDISQALEEGRITGVNPLGNLYGNNPFEVTDKDLVVNALPIKHYTPPPMLPEIAVSNLEFLEKLNPHGHTPIDKVTMGETGEVYALKMFRDRDPDEEEDQKDVGWSLDRFRREREAYAHFLQAGLCERGIVPNCYGWATLSRADVENCYALPLSKHDPEYKIRKSNEHWMKRYGEGTRMRRYTLLDDRRPHKAILFKYYPDTAHLTKVSISSQCAEVVLKGLHKIHATYVLHGDVNSRNILLMPDNRVMWCDFDESTCGSETVWRKKLTRQKLLSELKLGWDLLYPSLFPDKYCDFSSWLY